MALRPVSGGLLTQDGRKRAWADLGFSMPIEIGHVEAIFRYPVKSMGGERLDVVQMGWHGIEGDRRLAFRRIEDRSGIP
jgi:MOSC N-terminal beta barrel domain